MPNLLSAVFVLTRLLVVLGLASVGLRAAEPGPVPPDRRELWVPVDKIARVLGKKAMLLSREQYEKLLRDADNGKPPKRDAPADIALSSAVIHAIPDGKTAAIHADLTVNVLRDGWAELPLNFTGAAIGEVKLEGDAVLMPRGLGQEIAVPQAAIPQAANPQGAAPPPAVLVIRGRGEHRVSLELTVPVQSAAGVSSMALGMPGAAAGTFTLVLPPGSTVEKLGQAVKVTQDAQSTTAFMAISPSAQPIALAWKSAASGAVAKVPIHAQALVRYEIDAEKVAGNVRVVLDSTLGDLPDTFEFALAPGAKVLAVQADELRGWEAAEGRITARFQAGARKSLEVEFNIEFPALAGKDAATFALPLPSLKGVPRVEGALLVSAGEDVIVKEIATDASIRRTPTAEDRGERGFFNAFAFAGRPDGPRITIERAQPALEADLDTLVEFRAEAILLTRTVTLREQKSRRFSTAITLPAGEELIDVRRIGPGSVTGNATAVQNSTGRPNDQGASQETEPEWTREGGRVLIKWSDESAQPRVFRLRTRVEPEKWTQLPPEGMVFTLGDAKISDATKVAGYIALVTDPAFRLEAQPGETLERRDGRTTPVRGDYAWFRRDAFDLKVTIARRPPEVLAALTGYALPLEGLLDIRASMNYQFMGGGTRSVRIRVPKEIAKEFHFDGPGIAERALDGDVWTITFQKELTGGYALAITAQAPVARQVAADGDASKGYSFAAKVPVISPLDVVRASGLWAVEANTETEIRFDAPGMNELDSLLAPQIPGYAPRHRVIGVFGWLGAEYALTLNGVRHTAAGMLTAVVDRLDLNTVVSTSGLHRHEAIYRLRASGVEFLDVALPEKAGLLSVSIDGVAVKPVASRPGTVRLPLPAKRDTEAEVAAAFVYETPGEAWKNRGNLALAAPSIAKEIPVLKSTWRVWVPPGFSFSDIESNLPVSEPPSEEPLVSTIGKFPLNAFPGVRSYAARWTGGEGFVSTGRMMVAVQMPANDSEVWENPNFLGLQIEMLKSDEVLHRAHARVRSLHPELQPEEVAVSVVREPKSSILTLKVAGASPEYSRAFLDAWMDEYLATRKQMRDDQVSTTRAVMNDELIRLEKNKKAEEEELHNFTKENSMGSVQLEGSNASSYLAQLNRQLADLQAEMARNSGDNSRRESIRSQIGNLERVIKEWERKAAEVSRRVAEFDRIRSKFERTKAHYDRLQASMRSGDVTKNISVDLVSILERATPPAKAPLSELGGKEHPVVVTRARSRENDALSEGKDLNRPPGPAGPPGPPADKKGETQAGQAGQKAVWGRIPAKPQKTAGLLPVTLDLPKTGPALVFQGLYAPERLAMRYDDWWSRARHLWMWFVGGGIAFYIFAGRRPWWRTLWAALVLSAVPLCVSAAWMPVCNALLGGWLIGLVLNRIGAWCVFRVRKEALA